MPLGVVYHLQTNTAIVDSRLHSQCHTLMNYQPNTVVVCRSTGTTTWVLVSYSVRQLFDESLVLTYPTYICVLAPRLAVTPFEFLPKSLAPKSYILQACGISRHCCEMLTCITLAVLKQYAIVTDGQTDRHRPT